MHFSTVPLRTLSNLSPHPCIPTSLHLCMPSALFTELALGMQEEMRSTHHCFFSSLKQPQLIQKHGLRTQISFQSPVWPFNNWVGSWASHLTPLSHRVGAMGERSLRYRVQSCLSLPPSPSAALLFSWNLPLVSLSSPLPSSALAHLNSSGDTRNGQGTVGLGFPLKCGNSKVFTSPL